MLRMLFFGEGRKRDEQTNGQTHISRWAKNVTNGRTGGSHYNYNHYTYNHYIYIVIVNERVGIVTFTIVIVTANFLIVGIVTFQ